MLIITLKITNLNMKNYKSFFLREILHIEL